MAAGDDSDQAELERTLAYRFIRYETESGVCETVWNARGSGAVPTIINEAFSGDSATLIAITKSAYPNHAPAIGERIFIEVTETVARARAAFVLATGEMDPEFLEELQQKFESPRDAFESIYRDQLTPPRCPVLVVVNSAMAAGFMGKGNAPVSTGFSWIDKAEVRRRKARGPAVAREQHFYDRKGKPITVEEYLALLNPEYSTVAVTALRGGVVVSTVWLGIDHGLPGRERPMIFETRAARLLGDGVAQSLESARYSTEQEAYVGHARVVALMRANYCSSDDN